MKIWQELVRLDDSSPKHYFIEHLSRYYFIQDKIGVPAKILDVGCGTGYGIHYLCERATASVGLDLSRAAIQTAKSKFAHPKLEFVVSQGERLPFRDGTFDRVVSFEVIEHIPPEFQHVFLSEIGRVLAPNGIAFLSTPNRKLTAGRANPFHLKEFFFDEWISFLSRQFPVVKVYGQRCNHPATRMYSGKIAAGIRKLKGQIKIQFLLPNRAKRMFEFCLTGTMMTKIAITDYEFVEQDVKACPVFLALCSKKTLR